MRLRQHRQNLVVWSSSAVPAGRPGRLRSRNGRRPARARRIRRWLRTGALLMVIGVLRAARSTRARWEPVCLLLGALLTVIGFAVSVVLAFFAGLLVLNVTLMTGVASHGRGVSQSADCWSWRV